jgi:epoxyqueuosine reductase
VVDWGHGSPKVKACQNEGSAVPIGDRGQNQLFVDDALRRAGVDLWGAGANEPRGDYAPGLPVAISLIARIDGQALVRLEQGDATTYRVEYRRLNALLDDAVAALVAALRQRGHEAIGTAATISSELPESGDWLAAGVFAHKTAATRAGLGWIGKTGLFVSPEAGPKVRLATVFTDLPLDLGTPVAEGRCGSCRRCLDACPADAGRDVAWRAGMARELLFDAAACSRHMDTLGPTAASHTCGLCVAACPFGRPLAT